MASLLSKFRIDYSDLTLIPDITKKPQETSTQFFNELIKDFVVTEKDGENGTSSRATLNEDDGKFTLNYIKLEIFEVNLSIEQYLMFPSIFFSPHNRRWSVGGAGQDESVSAAAGVPAGAVDQVGPSGDDPPDATKEHRLRTPLHGLAGEPESGHAALPFCARQSDECADLLLVEGTAAPASRIGLDRIVLDRIGSIVFYLHLQTLKLTVIVRRTSILSLRSTTHVHKFRDNPQNAQRHWHLQRDQESSVGPSQMCHMIWWTHGWMPSLVHLCVVNINTVLEVELNSYLNAVLIIFKIAFYLGNINWFDYTLPCS